jgi:hypothetical protein
MMRYVDVNWRRKRDWKPTFSAVLAAKRQLDA